MGKNLKGKECGKGICQRKDGLYLARFVDKAGKRHDKCFRKLPEARNWLEEARVFDRQGGQSVGPNEENFASPGMTVDAWFEFWIENIAGDLPPNTHRNYRERYVNNVQPVIGKMPLRDVRPMHCKKILIGMDADYAESTIRQTYIAMGTMFRSAVMNGMIPKHPMDGVRYTKPVRVPSDIKYLTTKFAMRTESNASVCTR